MSTQAMPVSAIREYVRHWIRLSEAVRVVGPGHPIFEAEIHKFLEAAAVVEQQSRFCDWSHLVVEAQRQFGYLSAEASRDPVVLNWVRRDLRQGHLPYIYPT